MKPEGARTRSDCAGNSSTSPLAVGQRASATRRLQGPRAVLCPSCSYLYKADAWIVVSTGLIGAKACRRQFSDHHDSSSPSRPPRSARSTPAKRRLLSNPVGSASATRAASSPVRDTTTTPTRRSAVRSVTSVTASRTRCSGTRSPHVSGTGLLSRFDVAWPSLSASLLKSSHSTPELNYLKVAEFQRRDSRTPRCSSPTTDRATLQPSASRTHHGTPRQHHSQRRRSSP